MRLFRFQNMMSTICPMVDGERCDRKAYDFLVVSLYDQPAPTVSFWDRVMRSFYENHVHNWNYVSERGNNASCLTISPDSRPTAREPVSMATPPFRVAPSLVLFAVPYAAACAMHSDALGAVDVDLSLTHS
jgi:hypothetical protein